MKHYNCPGWQCPTCGEIVTLTEKDEAPDYCYKCPSCGVVTGANEWETAHEEAAKAAMERFATIQKDHLYACPRCGRWTMKEPTHTNALSRSANVYVCDECGTDEALRDMKGEPLPVSKWSLVQVFEAAGFVLRRNTDAEEL